MLDYTKIKEMFFPINGYDNYSISNYGNVKNTKNGRILKPGLGTHGYYFVNLCKFGTNKNFLIHRLVASAFIPNLESKKIVDHKDGNPQNNKLENLHFASLIQNQMNRKISLNNTSGTKGVCWKKI